MSGPMRWLVAAALALVLAGVVGGTWAWSRFQAFRDQPLATIDATNPPRFRVRSGDSVRAVLVRLERRGILDNDWRWRLLLRLDPVTIQAGEYELPAGTTPVELLDRLARGVVIQYRFTLVEGWNWRQLRDALQAEERLRVEPGRLRTDRVMAEIGSDAGHPEGWFLPETYAYTAEDDALDLLGRAHQAMHAVLEESWAQRDPEVPLDNPYELLILASIVEKETAVGPERSQVAGVFVRRLRQGWRLETDPTVIYGLGERYDGDIRLRDLREDTPYNTYVHRGLPPTPIAMPGAESLVAAARPAEGTAMFFVADGLGGHVFSETYADHERAVQEFLRRQRAAADEATGEDEGAAAPGDGQGTS